MLSKKRVKAWFCVTSVNAVIYRPIFHPFCGYLYQVHFFILLRSQSLSRLMPYSGQFTMRVFDEQVLYIYTLWWASNEFFRLLVSFTKSFQLCFRSALVSSSEMLVLCLIRAMIIAVDCKFSIHCQGVSEFLPIRDLVGLQVFWGKLLDWLFQAYTAHWGRL